MPCCAFHLGRAELTLTYHQLWDFCEFVFVYFFYVETKGPTLEEIARIFDGEEAVANLSLQQVEKEVQTQVHEEEIIEKDMHTHKSGL